MFSSAELFSGWYLHRQEGGEADRLVHRRCRAWLCDSAWRRAWESIFLLLFEGFVTFSGSPPRGQRQSELAWFHQPPGTVYRGFVWKGMEETKGRLHHRVSCRRRDRYTLTFLHVAVCYTLMDQKWKPLYNLVWSTILLYKGVTKEMLFKNPWNSCEFYLHP